MHEEAAEVYVRRYCRRGVQESTVVNYEDDNPDFGQVPKFLTLVNGNSKNRGKARLDWQTYRKTTLESMNKT